MVHEQLQEYTRKELALMARDKGVPGWHGMKKDELIGALLALPSKNHSKVQSPLSPANGKEPFSTLRVSVPPPQVSAKISGNIEGIGAETRKKETGKHDSTPYSTVSKDCAAPSKPDGSKPNQTKRLNDLSGNFNKDRIVVMVRDPYWLHCYWELTQNALQRAEVALNQEWHNAKPILRLLDVTNQDTTSFSETPIRDIPIHGGCNNWYIDVSNPPHSYRVDIGYKTPNGHFYILARSNVVTTPPPGTSDTVDENWSDIDAGKADRIHAMSVGFNPSASSQEIKQLFEERLRRPLGSPSITSFGSSSLMFGRGRKFDFKMDAELIIHGTTDPHARITLKGEPVKVRPDGTFTLRFSFPDGRQIIPAVAISPDGAEERTVVLAIERNTKNLEPVIHDGND